GWFRRGRQLVPVNDRISSRSCPSARRAGGHIPNAGPLNSGVAFGRDSIKGNAVIHYCVPVDSVVVDDGGVVVNARHFGARHAMTPDIALAKIMEAHECKMVGAQAEIKIDADVSAAINPAAMHIDRAER